MSSERRALVVINVNATDDAVCADLCTHLEWNFLRTKPYCSLWGGRRDLHYDGSTAQRTKLCRDAEATARKLHDH